MNIFVNGSGAKQTGALSILEKYFSEYNLLQENHYYVASPFKPSYCPDNVTWIKCGTDGLMTYLFSVFFCYYFVLRYRCSKIISFSNVNVIFPFPERITYFHQSLIFSDANFKFKILRFTVRFLNRKNNTFIVQNEHIKKLFIKTFGEKYNLLVKWPGLNKGIEDELNLDLKKRVADSNYIVIPIIDLNDKNKNFTLALDIVKSCRNRPELDFYVCSDDFNDIFKDIANLKFVGRMSQKNFYNLLSHSSGVLICSLEETLCLPIFEAIALNKRVFVYERPYLSGVFDVLNKHINIDVEINTFQSIESFFEALDSSPSFCDFENIIAIDSSYILGQWDF
ncbi:glycosyltransferase [Vibrio vulnificus]|nr:glycosyltransferase [Vibrio vulnificus]